MPDRKPGCFSRILRIMLCTGNVPTHPSSPSPNHVEKPKNSSINFIGGEEQQQEEDHHQSEPGLVAKLMGLDSLPPNTRLSLRSAAPESLSRSRSVSFVDFLSKLDLAEPRRMVHRRAMTSVSFREVSIPGTPPRPNDVKDRSTRPKRTKENAGKKVFPRGLKKSCERKNEALRLDSPREGRRTRGGEKAKASGRESRKKVTEKFVRRRKNEKSMATESSHETRSPISVLDVTRFSGKRGSISRPSKKTDSTVKLRREAACRVGDDIELMSSLPRHKTQFSFEDLAEKLVNLTTRDVSDSHWIVRNANNGAMEFEGVEEVCVELEAPILDLLLQEISTEILQM